MADKPTANTDLAYVQDTQTIGQQFTSMQSHPTTFTTTEPMNIYGQMNPTFNWHMFRSAVAGCLCCPGLGIFGMAYALLAYVDFENGNTRKYGARRNCSLGWSITAVVCGSLVAICAIVAFFMVIAAGATLSGYASTAMASQDNVYSDYTNYGK